MTRHRIDYPQFNPDAAGTAADAATPNTHQPGEPGDVMPPVQAQLAVTAVRLMNALDEDAIAAAPLNQRAAALGVVLNHLLKLDQHQQQRLKQQAEAAASQAAQSATNNERVYRVEYLYPDGSIHDTPPWAERDSDDAGSLSRGRLWSSVRQDGSGQDFAD